ncbi:MAG: hypothetical protein AAF652_20920 [Cyanobacteria bacterium P01_C01_bin.72]
MNMSEKSHRNKLPEWQSAKMKSLIEERWSEVWEIVVERERINRQLHLHSRGLPQ